MNNQLKKQSKKFLKIFLGWIINPVLLRIKKYNIKKQTSDFLHTMSRIDTSKQNVFYLGITNHSNLGDMAQHYCITKWIENNYPDANIIKVEADTLVCPDFKFMHLFSSLYRENDVIVFQSGYTTQDLGGCHEEMHRLVINSLPNAKILMMPQTIFFKHQENRDRTSKCYNQAKNMLFLARDMVSYNQAIQMFPDIAVKAFPDIVTSLIGTLSFNSKRDGVCLCIRDDEEKFYSDIEILNLKQQLEKTAKVTVTDTTIDVNYMKIRNNLQNFIEGEIEKFSKYKVTITDRYHGTIFSLAAGTPVIIIKTNDHKVITGADWFKGIYDDYVYVAADLKDAIRIYKEVLNKNLDYHMLSYFKENYYNKLNTIFQNISR